MIRHVDMQSFLKNTDTEVFAASSDLTTMGESIIEVRLHLFDSRPMDQRTNVDAVVETIADLERLHFLGHDLGKLVVHRRMNVEAV